MPVVKLRMVFDDNNVPDFGDITYDKNSNLVLTNSSVIKLITNVVQDVCGHAFNVPVGTKAFVVDTGAVFIYHANDRWYNIKAQQHDPQSDSSAVADMRDWKNPETYHAGYVQLKVQKNGVNYVLGDDEKIVFTLTDTTANSTIYSDNLTKNDYMGNGYYAGYLNLAQAKALKYVGDSYSVSYTVKSGETDITNTFTFSNEEAVQWYDNIFGCKCRKE